MDGKYGDLSHWDDAQRKFRNRIRLVLADQITHRLSPDGTYAVYADGQLYPDRTYESDELEGLLADIEYRRKHFDQTGKISGIAADPSLD